MLNALLFSGAGDVLGHCCSFQNRGIWQKCHSDGRWINSESYTAPIEIRLDLLETVHININYPGHGQSLLDRRETPGAKWGRRDFSV